MAKLLPPLRGLLLLRRLQGNSTDGYVSKGGVFIFAFQPEGEKGFTENTPNQNTLRHGFLKPNHGAVAACPRLRDALLPPGCNLAASGGIWRLTARRPSGASIPGQPHIPAIHLASNANSRKKRANKSLISFPRQGWERQVHWPWVVHLIGQKKPLQTLKTHTHGHGSKARTPNAHPNPH